MDLAALRVSLTLAAATSLSLLVLGLPLAAWLAFTRSRWRSIVEPLVALPLVLPPTVLGLTILLSLGPRSPFGRAFESVTGRTLAFSFEGLLVASILYSLPFAVQPFATAFASVDLRIREAAACLGASPLRIFLQVILPLSRRGLAAGLILSFAHTLGEFGVVLMVGGNIPGVTRTASVAIYDSVQALDYGAAVRTSLVLVGLALAVLAAASRLLGASSSGTPMIDVARSYRGGPTLRYSLDLPTAGTTVLFGPSGGGKTTLLRLLAGLDAPDSGTIAFGDRAWFDSGRNVNVPPQGRRIGYVTQEPALFPHLDVAANVGFGVAPADRPRRIGEALSLVGVSDLAGRMPGTLSGGQKQRVALARALAPAPVLLLLDEPLSALDGLAREGLRRDLGRTLRETGTPAVLVTHDHGEALALGDHVAIVAEGRILQTGPIAQVFSRPASLEAARIVGIETVLEARIVGEPLEGLVTLEASGVRLTAVSPGGDARDVFACIRADEVILEPSAGSTSARNRLPGIVREVREEGSLVRIDVDCGVPLAVRVTRPAARELGLAPGAPITAVIKAPAVHLIPRASR